MKEHFVCSVCGQNNNTDTSIIAKRYDIPFVCSQCGQIDFKYRALKHLVFIFPEPMEQKIGSIYVPDKVWDNYQFEYGIVLSAGKGYLIREING